MLKFLSKVRIEFNALDPRTASCMEFLAQCNARKAKESNPACQLQIKRRTDDHPPQISVTFVNGVEEVFDATSTPAQTIRNMILEKVSFLKPNKCSVKLARNGPLLYPCRNFTNRFLEPSQRKQKRRNSDSNLSDLSHFTGFHFGRSQMFH